MTGFQKHAEGCECRETHEWDGEKHYICRYDCIVKDCNAENCPTWLGEE